MFCHYVAAPGLMSKVEYNEAETVIGKSSRCLEPRSDVSWQIRSHKKDRKSFFHFGQILSIGDFYSCLFRYQFFFVRGHISLNRFFIKWHSIEFIIDITAHSSKTIHLTFASYLQALNWYHLPN